jgi:hypothetical protein
MKHVLAADDEYYKETIEGTRLEAVETSVNTKNKPGGGEIAK